MLKKKNLMKDDEVIKAIFDEVFLYKKLVGKYTNNHKIIDILTKNGYFNPNVKNVSLSIYKSFNYLPIENGFVVYIDELIGYSTYRNKFIFREDFIDDWLARYNG